jgi:hypothetical protein
VISLAKAAWTLLHELRLNPTDLEGLERRRHRSARLFEKGLTRAEVARQLDVTWTTALARNSVRV